MSLFDDYRKSKCLDCGAPFVSLGEAKGGKKGWQVWDSPKDWGPLGYGPRYHCTVCDAYLVISGATPLAEAVFLLERFVEIDPTTKEANHRQPTIIEWAEVVGFIERMKAPHRG